MKEKFSKSYQAKLLAFLKHSPKAPLRVAHGMGQAAQAAGLQTLDMAKLHEEILVRRVLPGRPAAERAALIKQAGTFFTEAIVPMEETNQRRQKAFLYLNRVVETLSRRTVELAASNLELSVEITQRKAAEAALKKSEHHYSELLAKSECLQEQLRELSRQILFAQEEERKEISRELHDVIAQTLTGINVRLAALKREAATNTKGLDRNIARTQRLVEKSVDIVHQFARELRPAVLDDLGLIPALHSFMKNFTARTGVRTKLTAFRGVEKVDTARRTVLFRVAQEAITNVGRHANATQVEVVFENLPEGVCMKIKDNGKSFEVERTLRARGSKRLGLLGMRERLEMVGGRFAVESVPGNGTTITALISPDKPGARGGGLVVKAPVGNEPESP
jgi:signal transduction histidine kinase